MATTRAPDVDQTTYWNEDGARRWIANIEQVERIIEPLSERLLASAAPRTGERVLDVGCGGGITSAAVAAAVGATGHVLGIDVSTSILDIARRRYDDRPNLEFRTGDATTMALGTGAYDLVLSRFGVMFFHDPIAAFTNLHRATRASGRLTFLCWREMKANPWMSRPAAAVFAVVGPPPPPEPDAPGPFAFANPERVRGILERSGYRDVKFEPIDAMLNLGPLDAAVQFMTSMGAAAKPFAEAPADLQAAAREAVRRDAAQAVTPRGVELAAATWIVTALAAGS